MCPRVYSGRHATSYYHLTDLRLFETTEYPSSVWFLFRMEFKLCLARRRSKQSVRLTEPCVSSWASGYNTPLQSSELAFSPGFQQSEMRRWRFFGIYIFPPGRYMVAMSVRLCIYSCFALSGLKGDDLPRWNKKEQQSDVRLCYFLSK